MKLSFVTSLYLSEGYIEEFYKRASSSANSITPDYEIIFVDDCSPDKSVEIVQKICETDSKAKLIQLAFNVGAANARRIGLKNATGEYVFMQDADLEEKPELIVEFFKIMEDNQPGIDVIFGFLEYRKGGWFERISGHLFYRLLYGLGILESFGSPVSSKLMKKKFVDAYLQFKEYHIFEFGIMRTIGFKKLDIIVSKTSRGATSWTLKRKLSLAIDSILSFSSKPLYLISLLGFGISLFSFLYIIYLIIQKLFFSVQVGYVSIIASIFLMGGIIMFSLGVIGLYISKIFIQVKNRPNYVIRNLYNIDGQN